MYGCENWSLTSREEHRLRIFENRVLRRIFGPKREEDGSWKHLHNDEIHSLYFPNIVWVIKSRRIRWAGHMAGMGEGRGVYRVLVGRLEGKRPLGRHKRKPVVTRDTVKQMTAFLQVFGSKLCMNLLSLPCVLHSPSF
jgi:hypothetical protein